MSPRIATRIALVSAREALALDEDMPPLVAALRTADVQVGDPGWDDPDEDWVGFDAAVLRSTWDYVERIEEFLAWAEHCAARTLLLNPPEVVRWNTDKHYLRELHAAGVPVVPTRFVEPGADVRAALREFLMRGTVDAGQRGEFAEFVVKPTIGAGSRDTARYRRDDTARAIAHIERLLAAGRSTILQPYLDRVDQAGETALIHFGGQFSHAIRKGPLLRAGAGLVDGLFAPEEITPREPDDGGAAGRGRGLRGDAIRAAALRARRPDPRSSRRAGAARARADRAFVVLRARAGRRRSGSSAYCCGSWTRRADATARHALSDSASTIASSATGLIFGAWPAQPKASKRALQMPRAAFFASISALRGSNSLGCSANTLRIAPVIARRMSVSMLILRTPLLMPRWISSTGTP